MSEHQELLQGQSGGFCTAQSLIPSSFRAWTVAAWWWFFLLFFFFPWNDHPKGNIPRSCPATVSRCSGGRKPLCCSISCLAKPAARAPQPAKPTLLSPAGRHSSAKSPFYPRAGKYKALLPDTMQVEGPISPPSTLSSCRGCPKG